MTINFNFKKYWKYFILGILCYILLHSFTNVKAWSNLDSQYIVNYTAENDDLKSLLIKGGYDDLLNIGLFDSDIFNNYYDSVKNTVSNFLNYSSFEAFTNDYYYISWFKIGSTGLSINFYYSNKSNINSDDFNLSIATTILSNSTPSININNKYYLQMSSINRTGSIYFNRSYSDLSKGAGNRYYNWNIGTVGEIFTCNRSTNSYCVPQSYNNNILTLFLNNNNNAFNNYFDTNKSSLNLVFQARDNLLTDTDYLFQKSTINNDSYVFNLTDTIFTNVLGYRNIAPNIQDLGDNSFGIKSNTTIVAFNLDNSIRCPNERTFDNNICYIYNTDVPDFDINNVNYYNRIRYYLGDNTNIPLRQNYYYILTFRVYSPFNLSVSQIRVLSGTTNNPTIINKIVVKDFFTYKDYQVVFQPNITGDYAVNFIDIYFNNYSNLVNVLPDNLSFGAYDFIKYSEYSAMPTDSDILDNYNNNNLDNLSTNTDTNFFTNFKINDRGLSQIVLLPLNFIRSWTNLTCNSISLPLPHLSNFYLPCVSSIMTDNVPTIWSLYKLLFNGFIIYRILISLFNDLKNIYKPDNDRIEVLDL